MAKITRLTNEQFNRMVTEAVSQILQEIGNTPKGQYMLGKLAKRNKDYPSKNSETYDKIDNFANRQRKHVPTYDQNGYSIKGGKEYRDDMQKSYDKGFRGGNDDTDYNDEHKKFLNKRMKGWANEPYGAYEREQEEIAKRRQAEPRPNPTPKKKGFMDRMFGK